MIDLAKEVAIVPLPLQFAMIADRAEVALIRIEGKEKFREEDQRALKNAMELLEKATAGEQIRGAPTRDRYQPEAIYAYEFTEKASEKAHLSIPSFRQKFHEELKSLFSSKSPPSSLSDVRSFFHHLAEWCLEQDIAEFEQIELGVKPNGGR